MKIKVSIERSFNKPEIKLKALARITIDNVFTIQGFRIMPGSDGQLKVLMPQQSYVDRNGKTQYRDIAYPITPEARSIICGTILKAYDSHMQREAAEKNTSVKAQSNVLDNSAELKPQLNQNYNYQDWNSLLQQAEAGTEPDLEMG
ncbi:septation protein SpoVG family protein [Ruminococcus sp. Marseille-P6503]|uniref:septation protein SpoVG family protein n=1 Tax=Ruminococcus sp. Marseille-P6503 TaxID=2364796 RepID=UPI000F52CEFD|nr:septation protein SpoVG family protein [Ruminococcus sp. Marseille-P6503]